MKYYKLYHNKETLNIKLMLVKETDILYKECVQLCTDARIFKYNNCFLFCSNRDNLKGYAIELKNQWITKLKEKLNELEELKI